MSSNLGKRTRFISHGGDCPCRHCRKARMLERRSMDPLTFRDKVQITIVTIGVLGISALFGAAAWVSWGPQ